MHGYFAGWAGVCVHIWWYETVPQNDIVMLMTEYFRKNYPPVSPPPKIKDFIFY